MSTRKVMMRKQKNIASQGYWIVDEDEECIAKTCSKCCMELPYGSFARDSSGGYGLASSCKECARKRAVEYRKRVTDSGKTNLQVVLERSAQKYKSRSEEEVISDRNRLRPLGTKTCSKCKLTLDLPEFGINRRTADGLNSWCKKCIKVRNSNIDPGTARGLETKYRRNNANRSEKQVKQVQNKLYPDGIKKCTRCKITYPLSGYYRDSTTSSGLDSKCIECRNKREKRRREERDKKHWSQKKIPLECYVCRIPWGPGDPSDHVVPKSLEGTDESHNRLPMCPYHNGSKWMTPLEIWLRESMPERMDEILDRVTGYGVDYRVPDGVYDGVKVFTDGDGLLQWERLALL